MSVSQILLNAVAMAVIVVILLGFGIVMLILSKGPECERNGQTVWLDGLRVVCVEREDR